MLDLNEEMAQALAGATVETAVRIGVPEDFVNAQTTRMLAAFSRRHPQVKLEISSGLSRDLAHGFDHGELDLVLVKQRRNTPCAAAACSWIRCRWSPSRRAGCIATR
ncbi:hypothetical protein G6F61_014725 [Rhizopus arrhizus]|nr:hypothetical protein G6F61_014725 [Rhizopus arrhizus]